MMRFLLLAMVALGTWLPAAASAHALDPAWLDLASLGQDRWRVTWRTPDVAGGPMPLNPQLPETCGQEPPPPTSFDGRAWTAGWIATCPGGLAGGRLTIEGLERTSTDALVRYEIVAGEPRTRRLTASDTAFTIPADAGPLSVLVTYVGLGVSHILEGVDHLLFVLALLLLIPDRRRLIWAVTAFTLAHSITLAAASLGWLSVPPPPVEAVIALSIVFLACELALPPARRDPVALRFPWLVSFGFGLIHGLGFAGALREIGLPEGDIPLTLFSFNLGVEIGQLLFISAVLATGAAARRLYPGLRSSAPAISRCASYAIGGLAAFWVIERVSSF